MFSASSVWSRFTVMKSAWSESGVHVKNGSTYSVSSGSGTSSGGAIASGVSACE